MNTCSVVLPCFNPQPNFSHNILIQWALIESKTIPLNINITLTIVNDGTKQDLSNDFKVLSEKIPTFSVISLTQNQGKGAALRAGFENADSDYYIFTDIDFPYMTEDLIRILETLKLGNSDIVVGVRDQQYYQQIESFRKNLSKSLRAILRYTTGIPVSDTQCGIKGFNNAGKKIFTDVKTKRYLFDLEFIFSSHKKGLKIEPIQVTLRPGIKLSKFNYKIIFQELFTFLNIFIRNIF